MPHLAGVRGRTWGDASAAAAELPAGEEAIGQRPEHGLRLGLGGPRRHSEQPKATATRAAPPRRPELPGLAPELGAPERGPAPLPVDRRRG